MSYTVVKEFISENAECKIVIAHREDGLYEVLTYKWTHEIIPGFGEVIEPFWEPVAYPAITDDLPIAEKLAQEELSAWAG